MADPGGRVAAYGYRFDCDGHIGLTQRPSGPGYYSQRIIITNTNKKFIYYIEKRYHPLFRIHVHKHKKTDSKDPKRNSENWKDKYTAVAVDAKARCILNAIYPYIIGKKDQIECMFEYIETILLPGRLLTDEIKEKRIAIYKKLKSLTKRGKH